MRFVALHVPDSKITGGIESSPGERRIEFDAEDKEDAISYCKHEKLRYVGPLGPVPEYQKKKEAAA